MPLLRLVKTRSKVNVVEPCETAEDEKPPRFSLADLQNRRVVSTQLQHRQFSDSYTENLRCNALLDGSEPYTNRASPSLVPNQQIDTTSSPADTPEPSIDLVRPFVAPTGRIDIEQAINLLQELKKTASPEELVSLHRALLPVKEVSPVYSPQIASADDSTFCTAIPPDRRRSVMPPGLATRNGLLDDILRRPESLETVQPAWRDSREMWVHAAQSGVVSKQHASQDQSQPRPETPSEQPNFGAYHLGTLRITNGAASPDPSFISRIAAEEGVADRGASLDVQFQFDQFGQSMRQSERPRPSGPRLLQRQSRTAEIAQDEANERQRPHSASASDPSAETGRFSFELVDSVPTSPSKPRYQQRWSHRAAHLSQQYLSDCDIGDSPFDEQTAQLELIKRLSTVPDLESVNIDQRLDPFAETMSKLTGDKKSTADAENVGTKALTVQTAGDVPETAKPFPSRRVLEKMDSGYHSDSPDSSYQQLALRGVIESDGPSTTPQSPVHEQGNHTNTMAKALLRESASKYTPGEDTTMSPMAIYLAETQGKRSSPLAFLRRHKASENSSVSSFNDVTTSLAHSKSSPLPASDAEPPRQPRKLQKRAPKSVRHRKQLETEMQAANDESKGATALNDTQHPEGVPASSEKRIADGEDGQAASPDTTGDDTHRFRLRGKSLGRKRSKTNAAEHSKEAELQASPLRTRVRRSVSVGSYVPLCPDSNHGTSCTSSGGQKQCTPDQVRPDPQNVARAPSSNPPHASPDNTQSIGLPRSVLGRRLSWQQSTPTPHTTQLAVQELPQNIPMPSGPPRATLEGHERVIPIGGSGSVQDLFPEWRSRPATPSPEKISSPVHVHGRPYHKSRSPPSVSSIPPLPELPVDIESKLSRADQMVAKKMLNSPRNSARKSPLSCVGSSEDSASNVKKRPANRLLAMHDDEYTGPDCASRPIRWSMDGTIPLPQPAEKSQPASPTHDAQHPGWPGWEKQADLWRQRKADLHQALSRTADGSGKTSVESRSSLQHPSTLVPRHGTPFEMSDAEKAQLRLEYENAAEKLAQAYAHLLSDNKENWPAQHDEPRPDSVDSSATMSSGDRSAMVDISRNGSAYSSASSNPSTSGGCGGGSPSPLATKPAMRAPNHTFIPYRPADAVQAERSRALSRARRTRNNPPGNVRTPPNATTNTSRIKETSSVIDRYSGGLGYGWDRSTGFGGSAGTLSSGTENVNRKSVKISEEYGLDLSDVPVFLRKAHTGNW